MRSLLTLTLLVLNLLWLPPSALGQQDGDPLVVSLPQGGFAAYKIEVSPLSSPFSLRKQSGILPPFVSRVEKGEGNVLHRLLADQQGRFVFVYDLVIIELDSPKRFEVSVRPLDPAFEQSLRIHNAAAFQNAPGVNLPTFARATDQQTISDGETVALDLLINEPLGVKVIDYVTFASERSLLSPGRKSRPPRDFGVYNVELAVKDYRLFVDEQPVVTSGLRNCTGAMIWFYLPGRGRFIFSLVPYDGYDFRKVGVIVDNKISFTWRGFSYEWVSREPIVGSGGVWNLWVLHDQDYADVFAPPASERKIVSSGRLFPKRRGVLTVVIPNPKDPEAVTMDSHRSANEEPAKRLRVVIGGARTIEALLPRK